MQDKDLIFGGDFFDLEPSLNPETTLLELREGELREVSVLFADIKGFSSISNLFDAETIHKKMDEIMKIFSRCITYYGGFVDKYMGDGIMALFGAKEASEQDTERAVMAAIKMQQQLRLYNALLARQAGFETLELGVRIGINTGLVSVGKIGEDREGDFTVYGPEVNLASRMESNAPVNRIMVPHQTMKIISRNYDFEPAGPKTVKGFDNPIDCYLVIGPKQDSSLHRRNHATGYVGRETELKTLQAAIDQLAVRTDGLIPVLGIRGEAGLGKTRLIYEFERANLETAIFLHGASSAISPAPLNLFSSVFETMFRLQVSENPSTKLQKLNTGFDALMKDADTSGKAELSDIKPLIAFLLEIKTDDPRLRQNGTDLLNHLSRAIDVLIRHSIQQAVRQNKPLVIVLDDLHWIDEASSKVLENLLNTIILASESPRLLLVLMYRLEYTLPGYLSHIADLKEIELKALDASDIHTLIFSHTKGIELKPETINKVILLSEGNPFFLEEWCNYIEDLPPEELRDFPVPANLHALILSRLDKLPSSLRLLLHKASVIGQEFFVDILKKVETRLQDPIDVDATLEQLEQQALIFKLLGFDFSTYFFKHITTREVAYKTLLHENRKMLHQLIGEAIEELFTDRLEEFFFVLGDHFYKAEIPEKALFYLRQAADLAARVYNNLQALSIYKQILEIEPDPIKKLELRYKIADINWLTGAWKEAYEEVTKIQADALEIGADRVAFDTHHFIGIASFYRSDIETSKVQFDLGIKLAERLKDPLMLCIANSNLGNLNQLQKNYEKALEYHRISLEQAKALSQLQRTAKTLSNLGLIYLEQENYALAEEHLEQSLKIAVENQFLKEESIALGNLGYAKMLQKDNAAAMPLLEKKLKLAEDMNDKLELIKVLGNIGNIHREEKRPDEALACYHRILNLRIYLGDESGAAKTRELIESFAK